jgi:hypothetical protein
MEKQSNRIDILQFHWLSLQMGLYVERKSPRTLLNMIRQTREHRFYAWLLKHLILPKCVAMWLLKKVSDTAQY